MRSVPRFLFVMALAMTSAAVLAAQSKDKNDAGTRTLEGKVLDADDRPVSNAVVQLKDTRTLKVLSFFSQENGAYHFSGLRTDTDYEVKAERDGVSSKTTRLSVFDTRKTPTVNLKLDKTLKTEKK